MIIQASQRSGGVQLAHHLLNSADNDRVEVHEVSGFMASDLYGAFKEAQAISEGTRCRQYLFSVSFNPPEKTFCSVADFEEAIEAVEQKLGLSGQPRAIVFHEKEGRRHAHVVWSRIDAVKMRAVNMAHYKSKLQDISRELYQTHDWEMPEGFQNKEKRDPLNYSHTEYHQAKRQKLDPKDLKALLKKCWQASDSKAAFIHALEENALFLAKGDRRSFVVIDHNSEIYSLSRWLGVKTKTLKAKLGEIEELPSIADVLSKLEQQKDTRYKSQVQKSANTHNDALNVFEQKREKLKGKHKQEAIALAKRFDNILINEYQKLRDLPTDTRLQNMWQRASGTVSARDQMLKKIEDLRQAQWIELETLKDSHLAAFHQLYKEKSKINTAHALAEKSLRKSLGQFFKYHEDKLIKLPIAADPQSNRKRLSAHNAEILITRPEIIGGLITQHESVFSEKDIAKFIKRHVDDGHDFQTILHAVKTSDEIIALKHKEDKASTIYYSTKEMIAIETEMIKLTHKLYETKSHGIHPSFVNEAIEGQNKELNAKFGGKLSDEQIEAIRHITGKERLSTLVGYAGAGKSTALKAARKAWESQGYKVHGAALAGKAAAGLEESSGIKSRTLHSYQYRWKRDDPKLTSNDVFVIDEAGMVGSKQMNYFLKEVQKAGAKIVLVGDSGQLQPIAAGGAFKAIEEITNPTKITEIRRQKQSWQRHASMDFANGNVETPLKPMRIKAVSKHQKMRKKP